MCGRTGDGWSEMKKWMNPLKNEESSQKWRPRHRCFIRIHWGVKNGERNGAMRTGTHATSGLNHSQPMTPTKLAWHQVQSFLLISPFHRAFGNLTAVIYLSSQTTGQVQTDNGGPDVDPGHVYYLTKGKHSIAATVFPFHFRNGLNQKR